ncbi:hypothetical protein BDP55DRAFT_627844 [Colletotrichum godetiae]|uniref:Secreted protein n=1 Tax=Colletotrichum godetiae TaxID=1209918 RepID=A0AAJ0EXQ5_9PEZI|nr:uncharacterized protein BDP55DRAFT_627844 [Colletotrichum godetiae]KAK1690145.1 hypothetical protein BDP55DRAFT_627844 [Colletotrichum godetiae]
MFCKSRHHCCCLLVLVLLFSSSTSLSRLCIPPLLLFAGPRQVSNLCVLNLCNGPKSSREAAKLAAGIRRSSGFPQGLNLDLFAVMAHGKLFSPTFSPFHGHPCHWVHYCIGYSHILKSAFCCKDRTKALAVTLSVSVLGSGSPRLSSRVAFLDVAFYSYCIPTPYRKKSEYLRKWERLRKRPETRGQAPAAHPPLSGERPRPSSRLFNQLLPYHPPPRPHCKS